MNDNQSITGDILDKVEETLGDSFIYKCTGGGRILVDAEKKTIEVFGYSQVAYSMPDLQCPHVHFAGLRSG